jgi:hypothetical protein
MSDATATTEQNEPINLRWSQELAASWSIMWPCWVASLVLVALIPGLVLNDAALKYLSRSTAVLVLGNFIMLVTQCVLAFRLVRKNYRLFWIGVLHEGEPLKRRFALAEQARVSLQILWLHVAFLIAASLFFFWITDRFLLKQ